MQPGVVWTIAGFDPSGGAGVTADLMIFAAHGLYGCSAITALTVQSTQGVAETAVVRPELLAQTLSYLQADLPPEGVKVGMLAGPESMAVVAEFLRSLRPQDTLRGDARAVAVVLDPVLRSSSGRELYPAAAVPELCRQMLPLVDVLTPNWGELAVLTGREINDLTQAEQAAATLLQTYPNLSIALTGGDRADSLDLLLTPGRASLRLTAERIETTSSHGTGCAFSSALLANLVQGASVEQAMAAAKAYVRGALRAAPGVGKGKGPTGLLWPLHHDT